MDTTVTTQFVLVNSNGLTHTEVHVEGCKAATRRIKGFPADVSSANTVADIHAMQDNPDEGYLRVHACAKAGLRR